MNDAIFNCLMTYRIVIVPPHIVRRLRPWYMRLIWRPYQIYQNVEVDALPRGAVCFDHQNRAQLMSARTAGYHAEMLRKYRRSGRFTA